MKLGSKVYENIIENNIDVRLSKYVLACSVIIKKIKGILVHIDEEDAEDPLVGLKSSDIAWKIAHETIHLKYANETMYKTTDGKVTIKNKEELAETLTIKEYIDEDDLLDVYVRNCGSAVDTAEDLQIPLAKLHKAFEHYWQVSEHFRERCTEINETYLWAQD